MKLSDFLAYFFILSVLVSSCIEAPDFQLDPALKLVEITAFPDGVNIPPPYQWVDCRPYQNYLDGHIPGAINIWRDEMADDQSMILSKSAIEQILRVKGIQEDAILILYDDHASSEAARLWWVMTYYGFERIHILNGGFGAWKRKGYAIQSGPHPIEVSNFKFTNEENKRYAADLNDVVASLGKPGIKIIDARTKDEYNGSVSKKGAAHGGSIPGSIHIDFMEAVSPDPAEDKRILPLDQLTRLFEQKGIYQQDTIIAYCHSGARSAHTTFILTQLLGYEQVRNYDGSWIEWSRTFK